MPQSRKKRRPSLNIPRRAAFLRQAGHCYYCGAPMWLGDPADFARRHGISERLARHLQCTGEHLIAWHEGGASDQTNIVAACWFCNSHRHRRKRPQAPEAYRVHVLARMHRGAWHPHPVHRLCRDPGLLGERS